MRRVMARLTSVWAGLSGGIRAAIYYGASLAWTKALSMLTLPLLTAMLVPADFARLELLSSAAEIAALLTAGGLMDTTYRFAGRDDEAGKRAASQILGLGLVIALAGVALSLGLAGRLAALMPLPTTAPEIMLLGIAVAMEALLAVPLAWLRMRGQAGLYAAATSLRVSLQVLLIVICVGSGWGVAGVLAGGAIAAVTAGAMLAARQVRETGLVLTPRSWGRLLAYSVPLIGSGLASFVLGTADRWILAGAVPAAMLGQYGLAAKISLIAALLTQPFELWWYPQRVALAATAEGRARSADMVVTGAALVMLAAAGASVAGPLLITLLTPSAYHAAVVFVPWLAGALALQSLGSLVNVGCYIGRTGMLPLIINGAAAAVALSFYLLLIPLHGVAGAIAATLLGQATRFGLFMAVSQRRVRLDLRLGSLALPAGLCVLAAVLPQVTGQSLAGFALACTALLAAALAAVAGGAVKSPLPRRGLRPAAG